MMLLQAALLAGLVLSQADESSREADMFGESAEPTKTGTITTATTAQEKEKSHVAPMPPAAGGDPFGEVQSDHDIDSKLGLHNNILDIGAFLYLRADYTYVEKTKGYRAPFSSTNLLDVYLDGRPSDRVRAFIQSRLYYNPTNRGRTAGPDTFFQEPKELEPLLDQFWLKFDVERSLFVTLGRQRIKWGSGRAWNPTDFLNDVRNPLDIFDARIGQDLIKLHYPVESLGWNFYALGTFSGSDSLEKVGGAIRGEFVVGPTELALSGAVRKDRPIRFGADLSAAIGPFDVHSELGLQTRNPGPFYEGEFSFENFGLGVSEVSRRDEVIAQWVSGAELAVRYGDQDSVYIGGEYFYNNAGYDNSNLYPYLLIRGGYAPFYLGRHYASLSVALPSPGDWNDTTFSLVGIANISDRSGVVRLDYTTLLLSYLRFNAFAQVHGGDRGDEFKLGFDVPAIPFPVEGVPAELLNGFSVLAPQFTVGVGLTVEI